MATRCLSFWPIVWLAPGFHPYACWPCDAPPPPDACNDNNDDRATRQPRQDTPRQTGTGQSPTAVQEVSIAPRE